MSSATVWSTVCVRRGRPRALMQWPDGRTCTLPGHTARPAARLTVLVLALLWLCLVGSMAEGSVARTAKKRSTSADGSANSADYNVDRIQRSLSLHAGIERTFWIAHKIGVTLEITANGTVRGTTHPNPPYGKFTFSIFFVCVRFDRYDICFSKCRCPHHVKGIACVCVCEMCAPSPPPPLPVGWPCTSQNEDDISREIV